MGPSSLPTDLPPPDLRILGVVPTQQMRGDEEEDSALLAEMLERARRYISSFDWCNGVRRSYFGNGVGGIVAVFLVQIIPAKKDVDEWLWIVEGDIPSAYFVTDDLKNPHDVLKTYIGYREKWVRYASKNRTPPKTLMPVDDVPPTKESAAALASRLEILKRDILPWFRKK